MIATLSISLPTAGAGGQLVVRHHERERIIDMTASEPSELAFAAFYADCEHEVTPVTEGHRLSLVFNLCLGAGDTDTPRTAPDYSREVDRLATRLAEWGRAPDAAEKLAWVLEHGVQRGGSVFRRAQESGRRAGAHSRGGRGAGRVRVARGDPASR